MSLVDAATNGSEGTSGLTRSRRWLQLRRRGRRPSLPFVLQPLHSHPGPAPPAAARPVRAARGAAGVLPLRRWSERPAAPRSSSPAAPRWRAGILAAAAVHEDDEREQLVARTTARAARRSRSTTSRSRSPERRRRWSMVRWWRSTSTGPRRPRTRLGRVAPSAIRPARSRPDSAAARRRCSCRETHTQRSPPVTGMRAPVRVSPPRTPRGIPLTGSSQLSALRISAAFLCAACAAPRAADTTIAASAASIDQRSPTAEVVASALELADLDALSLAPPTAEECADPSRDGYWHGAAYAFAPAVREARAIALAALAREEAAGAPGPLGLRLVDHEAGGDDTLIEAVATLDLLRLLGVGPASAEIALARATSLRALATLGSALWEAPFAVDRARIDLEAAQLRARLQAELADEAGSDLDRVAILEERDASGAAPAAVARGQAQATRGALEAARGSAGDEPGPASRWRRASSPRTVRTLRPGTCSSGTPDARLQRSIPTIRRCARPGWIWRSPRPPAFGGRARVARPAPGTASRLPVRRPRSASPRRGLTAMAPVPSSYEGLMEAAAVERDRALERYAEAVLALRIGLDAAATRLEAAERRVVAAARPSARRRRPGKLRAPSSAPADRSLRGSMPTSAAGWPWRRMWLHAPSARAQRSRRAGPPGRGPAVRRRSALALEVQR